MAKLIRRLPWMKLFSAKRRCSPYSYGHKWNFPIKALSLFVALFCFVALPAWGNTVTLTHDNNPVLYEDGSQGTITFTLSNTLGSPILLSYSQLQLLGIDFGDLNDGFSNSASAGTCNSGWNGLGSCVLTTLTLKADNSPVEADTDFGIWEVDWVAGYVLASNPQGTPIGLFDSALVRVNDGATPVPEPASWLLLTASAAATFAFCYARRENARRSTVHTVR